MAEWLEALAWRLSQPGFDPSSGRYCLATLMSSDRMKQICLWMTIVIYIYYLFSIVFISIVFNTFWSIRSLAVLRYILHPVCRRHFSPFSSAQTEHYCLTKL